MFSKNLAPEAVFTPRASEVNSDMYVERPDLEQALHRALRGSLHIVIHGESGAGKSWLYKASFSKNGVAFMIANLANASRLGSIAAELKNLVDREGKSQKTGYEETKSASVNTVIAEGGLSHTGQYEIGRMEPFESCLAFLRNQEGRVGSISVHFPLCYFLYFAVGFFRSP